MSVIYTHIILLGEKRQLKKNLIRVFFQNILSYYRKSAMPQKIVPKSSGKSGNTKQISCKKKWCFTIHKWTNDDKLMIENNIKFQSSECYGYAHELGKNGNTPHLQGFVVFSNKLRPKGLLRKEVHWEKMKGTIDDNITYINKEDGIKVWHKCAPPEPVVVLADDALYAWQRKLLNLLLLPVNDRTIYWIYEEEGKVGKSVLCKKICYEQNALLCAGKAADMKFLVYNQVIKKRPPRIVLFDVPRSNEHYLSYSGMEEIKNGMFCSNKYESGMCIFNNPHMVVFSNFMPKIEKMSTDRWKILKIVGDELQEVDLSPAQAQDEWLEDSSDEE